jgi:hypothetical protein
MAYFHFLKDQGMNYTLNRPLLDGNAPSRTEEIRAMAARITDFDSWHTAWLALAKRAEAEERWLEAASYYHGAEFYLPAGDTRNRLYDDFARTFARGMEHEANYERIQIPHQGNYLPGFRLRASGQELATLVFHGGYDSFVEEFYAFLKPLTEIGYSVIAFDGPGQGGAIRQGLTSPMHGNSRRKPCWTILAWIKSIGWAHPAAATWPCAPRRSSPGSAMSYPCRGPTGASIWRCGRCPRGRIAG